MEPFLQYIKVCPKFNNVLLSYKINNVYIRHNICNPWFLDIGISTCLLCDTIYMHFYVIEPSNMAKSHNSLQGVTLHEQFVLKEILLLMEGG